jgi:hypothetical protein
MTEAEALALKSYEPICALIGIDPEIGSKAADCGGFMVRFGKRP